MAKGKLNNKKFIFITGGVVSSLGKGLVSASIGRLLKDRGYNITIIKCDPYINIDAGTMNPYQHGEVYVTEDGGETDLDLGHYERFIDENLSKNNNITTGKIYQKVLQKERAGKYLGQTVRVIPHVTSQIKEDIYKAAKDKEVVIVEIGGTVGDIESLPFLEAIRQIQYDIGKENTLYIHLTLIPYLSTTKELKTKPTQHSVKELRSIGITPDVIIVRTKVVLNDELIKKISLYCNVSFNAVFQSLDVDDIYELPLLLENQGLANFILNYFSLPNRDVKFGKWREFLINKRLATDKVNILIAGKYWSYPDSYLSIREALKHAGYNLKINVDIKLVDANIFLHADNISKDIDAIIVPGGFGKRALEGKIAASKFAREKDIPFLGICYGMQAAVIDIARNVCGLKEANTTEIEPNIKYKVIDIMESQKELDKLGGTMRLGSYDCILDKNSLAYRLYKREVIKERHRHRYEFNNYFRDNFIKCGILFSGINKDLNLVEILEIPKKRFYIATQFHPEFKSTLSNGHPLFTGLVKAALKYKKERSSKNL